MLQSFAFADQLTCSLATLPHLLATTLQEKLDCACHQYADDTTIYQASKSGELTSCIISVQCNVDKLQCWANEANLVVSPAKRSTCYYLPVNFPPIMNLITSILT